jgi:fumarate reductase flavoprotein subunit
MPLKYLVKTVSRYNTFGDKGVDEDFEKPVLHRIDTPPFNAAIASIRVLDSYGGLRINGKAQVVDPQGQVVPGLYEPSGGGWQHGIGRASVHGYIAGMHATQEQSA